VRLKWYVTQIKWKEVSGTLGEHSGF
jgi:hypothetical protein